MSGSMNRLSYWRHTWSVFRRDWQLRGTLPLLKDLYYQRGPYRWGWIKGVDENGNRYYENNMDGQAHRRWVCLHDPKRGDASEITPEWRGWLGQIVEESPKEKPMPHYTWMLPPHKGDYLSQMGAHAEFIPRVSQSRQGDHETGGFRQGWYLRQIGVLPGGREAQADRSNQDPTEQLGTRGRGSQENQRSQKPDPRSVEQQVMYTAESVSEGPGVHATPSAESAATNPNDGGSAIRIHNKLYEPWKKAKREPSQVPIQELF